jgi:hypothetical protein
MDNEGLAAPIPPVAGQQSTRGQQIPSVVESIAKILSAVSWPFVVLICLFVLRQPLIQLLGIASNQFSHITTVKYKDTELTFYVSIIPPPPNEETLKTLKSLSGADIESLLKHECQRDQRPSMKDLIQPEKALDRQPQCFLLNRQGNEAREYLFRVVEAEMLKSPD